MPGEVGGTGGMGTWTTPDGIALSVPSEHLKSLEGLNERFSGLTKKEQELATAKKSWDEGDEARRQKLIDEWLDGITEEQMEELRKARFGEKTPGQPPIKQLPTPDSQTGQQPWKTDVDSLRKELETDRQARQDAEIDGRLQDAVVLLVQESPEFQEQSEAVQKRVLQGIYSMIRRGEFAGGDYEACAKDMFGRAMAQEVEYVKAVIEGHAASKKAGPGAPGKSAGDIERPADLNDAGQRRAFLRKRLAGLRGGEPPGG